MNALKHNRFSATRYLDSDRALWWSPVRGHFLLKTTSSDKPDRGGSSKGRRAERCVTREATRSRLRELLWENTLSWLKITRVSQFILLLLLLLLLLPYSSLTWPAPSVRLLCVCVLASVCVCVCACLCSPVSACLAQYSACKEWRTKKQVAAYSIKFIEGENL